MRNDSTGPPRHIAEVNRQDDGHGQRGTRSNYFTACSDTLPAAGRILGDTFGIAGRGRSLRAGRRRPLRRQPQSTRSKMAPRGWLPGTGDSGTSGWTNPGRVINGPNGYGSSRNRWAISPGSELKGASWARLLGFPVLLAMTNEQPQISGTCAVSERPLCGQSWRRGR